MFRLMQNGGAPAVKGNNQRYAYERLVRTELRARSAFDLPGYAVIRYVGYSGEQADVMVLLTHRAGIMPRFRTVI